MRSRKDLSDEKLVASTLYQSIFEKGEARGRARQCANTIIQVLIRRTGALDPAVATRIRSVSDLDTLDVWLNQALNLPDADSAHQLIEKISKAPRSSG
jgi:hypothetical protein